MFNQGGELGEAVRLAVDLEDRQLQGEVVGGEIRQEDDHLQPSIPDVTPRLQDGGVSVSVWRRQE